MIGLWQRMQAILILTLLPLTIQIDLALSYFYKVGLDPGGAHVRSRLMWSCDNIPPVGFKTYERGFNPMLHLAV